MDIKDELDTTGLLCPLPVLKLKKRIKNINKGEIIKIFTDDPTAELDIPHFCNETNNKILKILNLNSFLLFCLQFHEILVM